MQKRFQLLIVGFFVGLICVQLLLSAIPSAAAADKLGPGTLASNGETYYAITPGGTLVSWGVNEFSLVGRGLLSAHPYLLRTTVLRNVKSVACGRSCAMAVDENGTLWGWGQDTTLLQRGKLFFYSKPIRVMEDVAEIQLGIFDAAALKTDGTLWVWGKTMSGTWEDPRLILEDVASIYNIGGNMFAIRSNGDLYAWGAFALEGRENVRTYNPAYIASGIKAVSFSAVGYQCLTDDDQVFLFRPSELREDGTPRYYTLDAAPAAEQVRSLCNGGFVKEDNSLWTLALTGEGSGSALEKQQDDVAYAVNPDCFVTTDGRLHANGLWFPVSLYGLSPWVRTIFCIGVLCAVCVLIVNGIRIKKRSC